MLGRPAHEPARHHPSGPGLPGVHHRPDAGTYEKPAARPLHPKEAGLSRHGPGPGGRGRAAVLVRLRRLGAESVLVVDMPVSRGETITQDKLATIEVSAGTGHVVAADDVAQIIGRIALVDLTPGALVNHSNTGETLGVASDQAVVGIGLKSTNMPSRTLVAGDTVRIVYAPIDQTDTTSQRDITAIVEQTHFDDIAGLDIVDVRLDKDDAATAVRWSAGGSAAIVLDGGGR